MMDTGFEASFPVIFFDGESTMDMGNVFVDPSLDFKGFRSKISVKLGVSPHQITIYFERGPVPLRPPFSKVGGGRRVPVTNKFNFASILHESTCFFFVVSKRSRRVRRRNKAKQSTAQDAGSLSYPIVDLVARTANLHFGGGNFPYLDQYSSPPMAERFYNQIDYLAYTNRMRYMMSLNLNSNVYSDLDLKMDNRSYGSEITSEDGASSSSNIVCDVCNSAEREGETAAFHCCKRDPVVTTLSWCKVGPIAPPARSRLEFE